MSKADDSITRKDFVDLKYGIVEEITGVLSDAMTIIGGNFQGLKNNFQGLKDDFTGLKKEFKKVQNSQYRFEQKLDPTIENVDDIIVRVVKLEQKTASL